MDIQRAVARGIELLNTRKPGWFRHIDTAHLNLGECADCVIGQVFAPEVLSDDSNDTFGMSRFQAALKSLDVNLYRAFEYGFDADDADERDTIYNELTDEWVARIEELVNA